MLLRWRYSSPTKMQAMKNLAYIYLNLLLQPMWYLKSPPTSKSMTR